MIWNQTKPPLGSQINWEHPLSKGIVGCWLMNEGMGNQIYDLSGNKNTGVLTNMAHPSTVTSGWNPGKFGEALAFDGSNDKVIGSINGNLKDFYNGISVVVNFKYDDTTGTPARHVITIRSSNTSTMAFRCAIPDIFIRNSINGTPTGGQCPMVYDVNISRLYAITFNGVNVCAYKDGIIQATRPLGGTLNGINSLRIGADITDAYCAGLMDYVYIYNKSLTSIEMMQLYTEPFCFIQ